MTVEDYQVAVFEREAPLRSGGGGPADAGGGQDPRSSVPLLDKLLGPCQLPTKIVLP